MSGIKHLAMGLLVAAVTGLAWPAEAVTDESGEDDWSEIDRAGNPPAEDFISGTKGQFQAGVYYRFAGDRLHEGGENYLFSIDGNVLFHWDRRSSTWGLGLHVALDGDGNNRIAPKVLWRTSLKPDTPRFFQAGAGIFLMSSGNMIRANNSKGESLVGSLVMPGLFLEAEMSLNDWFSLTLSMETLQVEYQVRGHYDYPISEVQGETIDTHFYIGGKAGGWQGGLLLLAGIAVAGIVVASTMGTW